MKLISNKFRTCSLSNPAIERTALGGQHRLGTRSRIGDSDDAGDDEVITAQSTGFEVGGYGRDPLDVLIDEESIY